MRLVPALEQAYRHLSDVFGSPAPQPPAATSPSVNGASEELKVVQAQLELLRSAADNNGSPSSDCHQRVRRMLGLESRQFSKVFRRKLGGYYANMQGKFRPKFLRRVMKVLGVAVFEELAPLYTRITGQQVTVEVLRQEAAQ